jgi:hypothetical protein
MTLVADDGFAASQINPFMKGSSNPCDLYGTASTGPSSFGSGSETFATNGTGDIVGMLLKGGTEFPPTGASGLCLRQRSIGQRDLC